MFKPVLIYDEAIIKF